MAQCLMTFAVISSIEPSWPITVDGIMDPGLPPHTPYLGTPVVFPPGQRPVSFCFGAFLFVRIHQRFCRYLPLIALLVFAPRVPHQSSLHR